MKKLCEKCVKETARRGIACMVFYCGCNCHGPYNIDEQDEIQEDTTSMEEKLEALEKLHNDPKADILADMIK